MLTTSAVTVKAHGPNVTVTIVQLIQFKMKHFVAATENARPDKSGPRKTRYLTYCST